MCASPATAKPLFKTLQEAFWVPLRISYYAKMGRSKSDWNPEQNNLFKMQWFFLCRGADKLQKKVCSQAFQFLCEQNSSLDWTITCARCNVIFSCRGVNKHKEVCLQAFFNFCVNKTALWMMYLKAGYSKNDTSHISNLENDLLLELTAQPYSKNILLCTNDR